MRSSLRKKAFCLRVFLEEMLIRGSQELSHSMKIFVFQKSLRLLRKIKRFVLGNLLFYTKMY